jgi:serine/threonine protein kinase
VKTEFSDEHLRSKHHEKKATLWQSSIMPTPSEEYDWIHRYDRDTRRPTPAEYDIDYKWDLVKHVVTSDGCFNGGIDLVENKTDKELAIRKRLCLRNEFGKQDFRRWRREMLILRRLRHPNIPYFIDGFYTPDKGSIYMQPCRLGSVAHFVDKRKHILPFEMQEFFLWHILHEVATAILYMQTGFKTLAEADSSKRDKVRGWLTLIHCDIRTDQIFLHNSEEEPEPAVLLGDFGFAQFIRPWRYTEQHDGPGGPSCSKAPEFPHEISPDTDVFALGITAQMYFRPTERPRQATPRGWLAQLGVSHELDKLVSSCCAHNPSHRPSIRKVLDKLKVGLDLQAQEGLTLKKLSGPLFKCLYHYANTAYDRYDLG